MENVKANGLNIYFDPGEREAAETIRNACRMSIQTIKSSWELEPPEDCRVYVLNAWPRCVFQGAPLQTQVLLGLTMPFWYSEFKKRWQYAGGWAQQYGHRHVVGIKTPRLIENTPESLGEGIFNVEEDIKAKVLSIVSHELTHAFSSHLKLPTWLHEGLAMVTADRCLDKQTVRPETLNLLTESKDRNTGEKIDLKTQSRQDIVLIYVRGYWLTRYLAQSSPGLLLKILKEPQSADALEANLANGLGIDPQDLWIGLEKKVVTYYQDQLFPSETLNQN